MKKHTFWIFKRQLRRNDSHKKRKKLLVCKTKKAVVAKFYCWAGCAVYELEHNRKSGNWVTFPRTGTI